MPRYCSVVDCKNNSKVRQNGEKIRFFTFPRNEAVKKEWLRICRLEANNCNLAHKYICDKHFVIEEFEDRIKAQVMNIQPKKLKDTAIPTINIPEIPPITHMRKKRKDGIVEELIVFVDCDRNNFENEDLDDIECCDLITLKSKYKELLEENERLKELLIQHKITF